MDLGGLIQAGNGQSPWDNNGYEGDPGSDWENKIRDFANTLPQFEFYNVYTGGSFDFNGPNFGYGGSPGNVDLSNLPNVPVDQSDQRDLTPDLKDAMKNWKDGATVFDRIENKWNELKDTITDPKKLFDKVIKSTTGYDLQTNEWDPVSMGLNLGSGGIFSLLKLIKGAGDFFDVDVGLDTKIDANNFFNGKDNAPDGYQFDPKQIMQDNYQTWADIVPVYGKDGQLTGVGYDQQGTFHVVTPEELEKAGLTPGDLSSLDWSSAGQGQQQDQNPSNPQFNDDNSTTVTTTQPKPPEFTNPVIDPGAINGPPDVVLGPQTPSDGDKIPKPPGQNNAGGGSGVPTTPTSQIPTTPVVPKVPFVFFDMPDFKVLSPDFGKEIKPVVNDVASAGAAK